MAILDRVGKRRTLLVCYPFMILGLALAAVAFHFMTVSTGSILVSGAEYPEKWTGLMLGMMVLFIASYATGLGNVPWHTSELFPLEVRGMGSSALTASCWSMNVLISATFLTLMNSAMGAAGAFGLCEFRTPSAEIAFADLPRCHRRRYLPTGDDFHLLLLPRGASSSYLPPVCAAAHLGFRPRPLPVAHPPPTGVQPLPRRDPTTLPRRLWDPEIPRHQAGEGGGEARRAGSAGGEEACGGVDGVEDGAGTL